MTRIADVYSLLIFEEGERLKLYDDFSGKPLGVGSHIFGHPTIGVGRSLDVKGITQAESDYLLRNDVSEWMSDFNRFDWFQVLNEVRQAAIVDMAHDVGFQGVQEFEQMITALRIQDWKGAHDAVVASKWHSEVSERADRVANMLQTGEWPTA
jgi:lysozyme